MYLAPLNYDRYFKKVFSDLEISKQFLSDFLDAEIESIEMLEFSHKITDKSAVLEFDFRCKINGKYVIIDMQQWYKTDVVKRFYVYHCANTVLQLEHLLFKENLILPDHEKESKKARNYTYHSIEPVITLIWMVDDMLNFKDDFITYSTYPKNIVDFILKDELWTIENAESLLQRRTELVGILQNKTKNLDFLSENTMTYLFQKNIVKNKNYAKYARWFDFAEKTHNKNNTQDDFQEYFQDKTFLEIIRLISKEGLKEEDFGYIRTQEERQEEQDRWVREERMYIRSEVKEEIKEEVREEVKEEVREEMKKAALYDLAKEMLAENESIDKVAKYTGLSIEVIKQIAL